MLTNTLYVGNKTWDWKDDNGEIVESIEVKTPQIIKDSLFDSVQKRIYKIREEKGQIKRSKHKSLLKGLLVCGYCGSTLRHRFRDTANHYICPCKEANWKKPDKKPVECKMKRSLLIEETDRVVWKKYIQVISHSHLLKEEVKEKQLSTKQIKEGQLKRIIQSKKKRLNELKRDVVSKEEQLIDLEVDFRGRIITEKIYIGAKSKMESILSNIQKEIIQIQEEIDKLQNSKEWIDWIEHYSKLIDSKSDFTSDEQWEEIRKRIKHITVHYLPHVKSHKLTLYFDIPMVEDNLVYKNPSHKGKGYEIVNGKDYATIQCKSLSRVEIGSQKDELIKEIENLTEEDLSLTEISRRLNNRGIRTIRGKDWTKSSVSRFRRDYQQKRYEEHEEKK